MLTSLTKYAYKSDRKMNKPIPALIVLILLTAYLPASPAAPEWVAHASSAGPDQAPVGRSRFDQLFLQADGQYAIPYPFDALLASLAAKVDNGQHSGVRQVFIPRGRSLQRDAPAPDYFHLPRAVAALQGEPHIDPQAEPQAFTDVLEYRLFIAHQPSTHTLEIISYNDAAGRFEFQVVEDYGAGLEPRPRQANRQMCMSCHQNAAPIFSRRPWSETSFNFEIAERLARTLPQRFASLIEALSGDADAFDLLVDRANYLAAAQLIWQRGCTSAACRVAALRAVIQYRLSGKSGFAGDHPAYREDYLAELQYNWRQNWPEGLALGASHINDRNPFSNEPTTRAEDPLSLRPPHASWLKADAIVADGVIYRLAGFLTQADTQWIDRYLVNAAARAGGAGESHATRCRLANVAAATRLLECSERTNSNGLHATIELEYHAGKVQSLHLLSLRMPGDHSILQPIVARLSSTTNGLQAELQNHGGISMRLDNGDRLATLELHWQDQQMRGEVRLQINVVNEFGAIDIALAKLLQEHRNGDGDSLRAKPFRRRAILTDLERVLGTRSSTFLQQRLSVAGAPVVSAAPLAADQELGDLALLQPYCAHCHQADTRYPPGFLSGSDAHSRVAQCAPRILARLQAWQEASNDAIVPMPPPTTIHAEWIASEHYRQLVDAIEKLVQESDAALPVGTDVVDYERLPPCQVPG